MEKKPIPQDAEPELLKKVRLKESEIEKSIQAAHLEARERIEQARREAEQAVQKAQVSAQEEMKRYQESRKQALKTLTEKMLLDARGQVELIHKEAKKNFDQALQAILSAILPSVKDDETRTADEIRIEASS